VKDSLAQALLGKVMGWDEPDLSAAEDLRRLQTLAGYKYDHYERFRPGRKFIESLADWLQQFQPGQERRVALDFVESRLIFVSNAEMEQLVRILYPTVIRSIIREYVASKLGLPPYRVAQLERRSEFALVRRQSLYLGLSDGARIDEFRRSNRELSHEQVYATYEVAEPRLTEMRAKLLQDRAQGSSVATKFELVFLIDDFAGSGKSILRRTGEQFEGRLKRFSALLQDDSNSSPSVFSGPDTKIHICLYMATQQAVDHLTQLIAYYTDAAWNSPPQVHAVQVLNDQHKAGDATAPEFCQLLDKYYDPAIEDAAKQVGGTSSKYGFAECALPLVLSHNTPNNSVSLLWAPPPMKALFPRFERHAESKG
jgi:hypothetical protein